MTHILSGLIAASLFSLSGLSSEGAQAQTGNCMRLCDTSFMDIATLLDVKAEIVRRADESARTKDGRTAFDLAKENDKLKGTKAYWLLNEARFK